MQFSVTNIPLFKIQGHQFSEESYESTPLNITRKFFIPFNKQTYTEIQFYDEKMQTKTK